MNLKSSAINYGYLDDKYGIKTENKSEIIDGIPQRSFPLEWDDVPDGTKSFALIFQDFDNVKDEGVIWIHWLISDIPSGKHFLEENESRITNQFIQGRNSWALPYGPYKNIDNDLICHYGGPAPENIHEYEITLFALDNMPGMQNGFYYNDFRRAIRNHILEECTIKAFYKGG